MDTKTQTSDLTIIGIILSGLAMSVGWGFRGDYGHEAGAMVPGALLGLSICLASGRQDRWQRSTIMAIIAAIIKLRRKELLLAPSNAFGRSQSLFLLIL